MTPKRTSTRRSTCPTCRPNCVTGSTSWKPTGLAGHTLLTLDDIRGDLHCHTIWSDGRDTTEAIVRAARRLGYEYVAITDHSPSARASRVLTLDRLRQQKIDVRQVRERFPDITILHGTEVDILPDGRLDFPDDVLAEHGHRAGLAARSRRAVRRTV